MENRRNIIIVTSAILAVFCWSLVSTKDIELKSDQSDLISISDQSMTKKDSLYIYSKITKCYLEYTVGEFANIKKYKVMVNDTIAMFQIQDLNEYLNRKYTQVTLNKETLLKLKDLLYMIYSKNKSILKTGMPNYKQIDYWYAKVKIGDKIIDDKVGVSMNVDYGEEPTVPEFYKLVKLFYDISFRMEYDFYEFNYRGDMTNDIEENKKKGAFYDLSSMVHGYY